MAFFDLFKTNLLSMVDGSREGGRLSTTMNANFVVSILKKSNDVNFNDFRPISLCNLIYKPISKIIASRLKKCLSKSISKEKFSFLINR